MDVFYSLNPIHDIYTNEQDIKIISPPKQLTIQQLINDENTNNIQNNKILNTVVYHVATLWNDSDTEYKIAYNSNTNSLIGYDIDTATLTFSKADLTDFSSFITLNYSNHSIINTLFKLMAAEVINIQFI